MSADYLFQQDKPYDVSFDTGDKAMQCGRHNDIFKLWLMWRSKVNFTIICIDSFQGNGGLSSTNQSAYAFNSLFYPSNKKYRRL